MSRTGYIMSREINKTTLSDKFFKKRQKSFVKRMLQWYESNKRAFSWRTRVLTPYQVLILEIMLQRTPAERVDRLFSKFLNKYPDPYALFKSSDEELELDIQTLGLQKRRRKLLKDLAAHLIEKCDGQVPIKNEELLQLPCVGRYAANAVLCYSHGKSVPLIDTNASRVLGRVFGLRVSSDPSSDKHLWIFAQKILPKKKVREFNWALIDFGALLCKPKNPLCGECPMCDICVERSRVGN